MRRWISGFIGSFTIALIGLLIGLTSLGAGMEQSFGLRWLFLLRGPVTPPPDVAVVAIDDQTGGRLGLSRLPREWPRSVHARLVDALMRRGVSAIVFDFDFSTPKQPEDDAIFAKAVAASGRTVLTEKLIGKRQPLFGPDGRVKSALWVEQLVAPLPILADAAKGAGTFPLPKVDVAVHEFWVFKHSVEYAPTTPTMALQIHAQDAYPKLLNLLEQAGVSSVAALPRQIEPSARTPQMRKLMADLRQALAQTPDLETKLIGIDKPEDQLVNALLGLYSGNDHRYLNFYGPPGTITTIPYYALLDEASNAQKPLPDLAGKVVFVGYSDMYDPSQPDRFYTVFTNSDGIDLSGVEIAATAFGNLLTDRSLIPPEPATTAAVLAGFGAITGGLTLLLPAIASVPLSLIGAGAYFYFLVHAFSEQNLWLPLTVPLLVQLPMALFFGLLAQYLSERRKKKRATHAISYYLPEKLAKDFTEKNLESGALNKVTYSVCFASDMAGFTTISEQLPPKELAVFLNDYFESLSHPIRDNGVDVIEFRADGIMCAWTAEKDLAAIRRQAAIAALEAVEAIKRFSQRRPILSQPLRIGLEAGMVYVGHSGGGGHFVYSIVGDCANTAARIEGLNKKIGTQILASRAAVDEIDDLLLRYLGDFQFVGKTEALPIVEIIARKSTATQQQIALCVRYAEAMKTLVAGNVADAARLFEAIANEYPDDGPSRFHLAYCQDLQNKGEPLENPSIIKLESK